MDVLKKTTGEGQPKETMDVKTFILSQGLPDFIEKDLVMRLDAGEKKYGHKLKMHWKEAKQELYQELLDGYLYAASCGNKSVQNLLLSAMITLNSEK